MRTRNSELAIRFLYGSNMQGKYQNKRGNSSPHSHTRQEIQISFDYNGIGPNFETHFGAEAKTKTRFDSVLQYVTFPEVNVSHKVRPVNLLKGQQGTSGC